MKAAATVGFRLSPSYLARLAEEAEKAGTTPGTYARRVLVAHLEGQDPKMLRADMAAAQRELSKLQEQVSLLRRELGSIDRHLVNGVMKLLNTAGQMKGQEVNEWAKRHLGE